RRLIGEIAGDPVRLAAGASGLRGALRPIGDIRDRHACALARQPSHDGSTDTVAAARDDRHFVVVSQHRVAPPSMQKSAAVTHVDSSDARYTAHHAISSGCPSRFNMLFAMTFLRNSGCAITGRVAPVT